MRPNRRKSVSRIASSSNHKLGREQCRPTAARSTLEVVRGTRHVTRAIEPDVSHCSEKWRPYRNVGTIGLGDRPAHVSDIADNPEAVDRGRDADV